MSSSASKFQAVVLLGAPGSGKGTQASLIKKAFGFFHLSLGDVLRRIISDKNSRFHEQVYKSVSSGDLVEDELVFSIFEDTFNKVFSNHTYNGVILDGFPRSLQQALFCDKMFYSLHISPPVIILLDIPEEDVASRILSRFSCSVCGEVFNSKTKPPLAENTCDACNSEGSFVFRTDDDIKTIENRIRVYKESAKPMINHYGSSCKKIDSTKSREDVFAEIKKILES